MVEEGMTVRRGQVLARLDESSARAAFNLAAAQAESARRSVSETDVRLTEAKLTLGRREALFKDGVIGKADVDAAQAEVDSLAARAAVAREQVQVASRQVDVYRTSLDDLVIRAPFDGVAISKDAQPGEMVSPVSAGGGFTRTGITTLVDMTSLEIEVDGNESYIGRVKPGQRVTATLDAYPDWTIPAHVITTIPAADRQKATVLVRIGFDALDARLIPDMGVKVAFHDERESTTAPGAEARPRMLIPASAARGTGDTRDVFVVKDSRVERRAVRVGAVEGALIVVLDQFSRNLYRNDARAFTQDAHALECAKQAVARGDAERLLPVQRQFLYLPFEHSEDLADQERGLELMQRLEAFEATRGGAEWAARHRDIVKRFGRFPHRNAALGRETTAEEAAFLLQPGSGF